MVVWWQVCCQYANGERWMQMEHFCTWLHVMPYRYHTIALKRITELFYCCTASMKCLCFLTSKRYRKVSCYETYYFTVITARSTHVVFLFPLFKSLLFPVMTMMMLLTCDQYCKRWRCDGRCWLLSSIVKLHMHIKRHCLSNLFTRISVNHTIERWSCGIRMNIPS